MGEAGGGDAARNGALDTIAAEWKSLLAQRRALQDEQTALEERLRVLDEKIADCQAAARLFGGTDIAGEAEAETANKSWTRLLPFARDTDIALPRDEITPADLPDFDAPLGDFVNGTLFPDLPPAQTDAARHKLEDDSLDEPNEALQRALQALTGRPSMPRIRDVVLDRLKEAGDNGSKAAPIQAFIEETYGQTIHDKTVGMTLYRLQRENLVRREGHVWFYAVQDAMALTSNAVVVPQRNVRTSAVEADTDIPADTALKNL